MRVLNLLPIVAFATTVLADGASIVAAMTTISKASITLNSTVASWNGDLLTVLSIVGDSTALLIDIKSGTTTAQKSANLTLTETISVASATESLATTVQSVLSTIVSKKSLFQRELLQGAILLNLLAEKSATDSFSAAVVSKVPAAYQGIATSLTAPIDTAFNAAIAAYE